MSENRTVSGAKTPEGLSPDLRLHDTKMGDFRHILAGRGWIFPHKARQSPLVECGSMGRLPCSEERSVLRRARNLNKGQSLGPPRQLNDGPVPLAGFGGGRHGPGSGVALRRSL